MVILVTVVRQIKMAVRLSEKKKKQGFRDVGNTASFCMCHPNKTNGSDITGSGIKTVTFPEVTTLVTLLEVILPEVTLPLVTMLEVILL
jgi:hypothetical protein